MERELRKRQSLLVEAGAAVVLFAFWSVAKVNLYLGLSSFPVEKVYEAAAEYGIDNRFFMVFMLIFVAMVLLWQLSIRLYIGMSATAEGKGKKKGWAYLVVAAVLLVWDLHIYWQIFDIETIVSNDGLSAQMIMGFCVEIASAYVLLELMISGVRVKMLRKKMKE